MVYPHHWGGNLLSKFWCRVPWLAEAASCRVIPLMSFLGRKPCVPRSMCDQREPLQIPILKIFVGVGGRSMKSYLLTVVVLVVPTTTLLLKKFKPTNVFLSWSM